MATVDRRLPTADGVTILIYHRVGGGSGSGVDLDAAVFRRQVEHLAANHRVISLDDAVQELATEGSPPDHQRGVVITFDDGTSDFVEHAVPALVDTGLPATLFACTESIDEQQPFPWGAPPATWNGLREASSTGLVSIESHTHTHRLLDRAPLADIEFELDRSIELIGEHIGRAPRHFAYPKAVPGSAEADAAVRDRFGSAALARNRVNQPGKADLHRLGRTPVRRVDDHDAFVRRASGKGRIEGELRHIYDRWRYRGLTR